MSDARVVDSSGWLTPLALRLPLLGIDALVGMTTLEV